MTPQRPSWSMVLWARNGTYPPRVSDIQTDAVLAAVGALP
jgi:hypothetical protein